VILAGHLGEPGGDDLSVHLDTDPGGRRSRPGLPLVVRVVPVGQNDGRIALAR